MLLFARALNALLASRGRRGVPTRTAAVRLEALAIAAIIFTGGSVVVATDPQATTPVASSGASKSPAVAGGLPAQPFVGTLGRPSAAGRTPRSAATPATKGKPTAPGRAARRAPVTRWLPTGTGMWTYLWENTEGGNARAVVRKSQAMGLSHLYVRTGTRKGGFDGGPVLDRLLPATRGTDLKIIAWDFPQLKNPIADARRLARAAWHDADRGRGTLRVAAVAPDIETSAEGTQLSAAKVDAYYRELRFRLPSSTAILATVPWPSEHRLGKYPFALTAKHADALVPMAYWINRNPVTVTRQTMQRLKRYGKPVMPAGQAYDPRIDVPTLKLGAPSKAQVDAFFRWSKGEGAPAASLWVWNTANSHHWASIKQAARMFEPGYKPVKPVRRPAKPVAKPTDPGDTPVRKPREPRQATRAE